MITDFKIFEIKTDRPIHVGDEVTWLGKNEEDYGKYYTPSTSKQANNGDLCIITDLKTVKGQIYAKAKNKETDKPLRKIFDSGFRYMPYSQDGHWFEFDTHFKHELDMIIKKYNL